MPSGIRLRARGVTSSPAPTTTGSSTLARGATDSYGFAYTSLDGGATWTNVALPHLTSQTGATGALSDMDAAGDPAIAFGRNNPVYYANIAFSRLNDGSAITVNVSHDGGFTWSEPSIVALDGADANGNPVAAGVFNDKEWVGVDQNSGAAHVSWTRFGPSGSPIVETKSVDGGTTWSPRTTVTPSFTPGGITPFDQGSFPLVGSDGAVYIAYEGAVCQSLACDQATDHDAVIVAKSTNGGRASPVARCRPTSTSRSTPTWAARR